MKEKEPRMPHGEAMRRFLFELSNIVECNHLFFICICLLFAYVFLNYMKENDKERSKRTFECIISFVAFTDFWFFFGRFCGSERILFLFFFLLKGDIFCIVRGFFNGDRITLRVKQNAANLMIESQVSF